MNFEIIIIVATIFGSAVLMEYMRLKKDREEINSVSEAWRTAYTTTIKAMKADTAEDFATAINENDEALPEQENNEIVDMYNVDEEILIKKLVEEENDNKQNQDKES